MPSGAAWSTKFERHSASHVPTRLPERNLTNCATMVADYWRNVQARIGKRAIRKAAVRMWLHMVVHGVYVLGYFLLLSVLACSAQSLQRLVLPRLVPCRVLQGSSLSGQSRVSDPCCHDAGNIVLSRPVVVVGSRGPPERFALPSTLGDPVFSRAQQVYASSAESM